MPEGPDGLVYQPGVAQGETPVGQVVQLNAQYLCGCLSECDLILGFDLLTEGLDEVVVVVGDDAVIYMYYNYDYECVGEDVV